MKIRLGYVSIATTLDDLTTSRLLTVTHYKKLGRTRGLEKLLKITKQNLDDFKEILKYNLKNDIYFYRMSSNIFPLADMVDFDVLSFFKKDLEEIGMFINKHKMRVDMHLDHFYVLNSVRDDVVLSTINILKFYQNIFQFMQISGKIVMHVGSKTLGKREGMKRFIKHFMGLDENIKNLIILENDDKVYSVKNTLYLCKKLGIPMVLDYHHFLCNKTNEKIEDYIIPIFHTWKEKPKIHFSSPASKKEFRAHHNYIDIKMFLSFLEKIKFCDIDFDIMIEAKAKDEAMFRLIRHLKYLGFEFIDGTTFIVRK